MSPIFLMIWRYRKIDRQQTELFSIEQYAIEPTDDGKLDLVGDWEWEQESKPLLPKTEKKTKPNLSSLILKESENHPDLTLLPKTELALLPNLDIEIREQAKETYSEFVARIREQKSKLKLLPRSVIREQLKQEGTIFGKSLTKVKGKVYILTHSKSNEPLPENKGWFDIKKMGKYQYLYLRWRDEDKQRSRCMGRVDLVD